MTYNELAELFKREGGDAQVCFSVISQNQILFGNNDTKKDIISFKNEEPIKWVKEAQEESVSEDLEEAAERLSTIYAGEGSVDPKRESFAFYIGFKNGAKQQKDKMIQNTIDAHCFGFQGAALFSFRLPADNYLVGSEVKVIVIKKDEL